MVYFSFNPQVYVSFEINIFFHALLYFKALCIDRDLSDDINKRSSFSQVHVLILGDNNIRWGGQLPKEIVPHFRQVADFVMKTPNAHLVIVSLLPSPETDTETKPLFRRADKLLHDLAKEHHPFCSYLDITCTFTTRGYTLLWQLCMYEDGIHLSAGQKGGANTLAKCLRNHLMTLPK